MIDDTIVIYDYPRNSYLELIIEDGSFKFVSEVRIEDDEYSETCYLLNKKEVDKVLAIMSFGDFIEFCRRVHLKGILDFFKNNNIDYIIDAVF